MIGRLTGRVVGEEPTGQLVIDIQGVGYEVMTPVALLELVSYLETLQR